MAATIISREQRGAVHIIVASGTTPEGSVSAPAGSVLLSTSGIEYLKSTGTGNTGWSAVPSGTFLTSIAGLGVGATSGLVEKTAADTSAIRAIGVGAATSIPTRGDADTRYGLKSDSWSIVVKPSGTSRTNNTLSSDPHLVLPMLANTNYTGTITVYLSASAAGDFKSRLVGPGSPTSVLISQAGFLSNATGGTRLAGAYDSTDLTQTSTSDFFGRAINFSIRNGANAGNLDFQWAQNTTSGNATDVLAGSTIEWMIF